MNKKIRHFRKYTDNNTLIVMGITLLFFLIALFAKGFTHDFFLESAIFLVSVKIILSTYKLTLLSKSMEKKIDFLIEKFDDQDS